MTTTESTYDSKKAEDEAKRAGLQVRTFQKSSKDGKGNLYRITRQNGRIVDVTMEFDPYFG